MGDPGLYRQDTLVNENGYLTDLLTNEAVQFIAESSEGPFFAYIAYNVGLPPYQGPELPEDQWEYGWNVNEASREDYVAMVEAMDEGIGRILDVLDELELADNTLVVFAYDHGGQDLAHSEPLFHGFSTLWEGGIRVPLLMRWPQGFGSSVAIDRPSIAMDITATLLEVAGRDPGSLDLDGSSLLPLLAEGELVPAETLFWRYRGPRGPTMAVRRGSWKYLRDADAQFLFNLDADIGERRNRFSDRPEIASELREELRDWVQNSLNP
jgi:arylsulfatase A-like enzyme